MIASTSTASAQRRGRSRHAAALGLARQARHDRHQVRLRHGAVRRLHRAPRRRAGALVLDAGLGRGGQEDHDDRGVGATPTGRRCRRRGRSIDVPQCGYCQSGQIMAAAALLRREAEAERRRHRRRDGGNICRCGTYPRIRAAIHKAAGTKGA